EPDGQEHGARHELERVWKISREVRGDGLASPQGASQVAAQNSTQVLSELNVQRPIEAVLDAEGLDHRRRRVGPGGEPRRVAGRDVRDDERDAEQAEQHEAQQKAAPGEVAEQAYLAAIASG